MIINNMINRRIIYINNVINFFACMLYLTLNLIICISKRSTYKLLYKQLALLTCEEKKVRSVYVPGIYLYLRFCTFQFYWVERVKGPV